MKIALGQINPTIGDFDGNVRLIEEALGQAEAAGADLLVLPELAVSGYPPRDLLERPSFIEAAEHALARIVKLTAGPRRPALLIGFPERLTGGAIGRPVANAAAVVDDGRIVSLHRKSLLPTYDVFDEDRYFEPGRTIGIAKVRGKKLGVSICEDAWNDAGFWTRRRYAHDPIEELIARGAEILVNIAASPFTVEKRKLRPRMLAAAAKRHGRPLIFCNQVGGHDDLVFDGASMALDENGEVLARAREHAPDLLLVDLDRRQGELRAPFETDARSALEALTLGTRDYARRCGFKTALLGLSGGIDSAVVACVAARALGADNVLGVALPSRYSSQHSRDDAAALAQALGIQFREIPIEGAFASLMDALAPAFGDRAADVTEENLQARVRGTILMSLSNKFGSLLLTTGNKSELATGYCTLYGDMAGGLAVISDVPKTYVYKIAAEINADRPVIPQSTMTKAPSAELRPDQKDSDSLPAYETLDPILEAHLEKGLDASGMKAEGYDPATVDRVVKLVRLSEHKRRQLPPGLKITSKAFGPGRRFPIAHGWKE